MVKKLIKRLIPKRLKKDLLVHYTQVVKQYHAANFVRRDSKIPLSSLSPKHIENLKALVDRFALLDVLPKNAVVAEIGVDTGDFSKAILEQCSPKKLHLIDAWGTERYHKGKRNLVTERFAKPLKDGQVVLHEGLSTEVGHEFPDHYFDWVYIDTDHSYQTTLAELLLYHKKVKVGGYITGHDFIIGSWAGLVRYGVIDAVYEFCNSHDWELVYLTMEHKAHPSFAIKKL